MRELYRTPHIFVTIDEELRLVRRTRTALGFSSIAEASATYEAMLQAIDAIDKASHALFVDMRLAPPRNDPAFEQLVHRLYPQLYGGYRRIAALVLTQAGRLQLGRLLPSYNVHVFMDEQAALAYLAT